MYFLVLNSDTLVELSLGCVDESVCSLADTESEKKEVYIFLVKPIVWHEQLEKICSRT